MAAVGLRVVRQGVLVHLLVGLGFARLLRDDGQELLERGAAEAARVVHEAGDEDQAAAPFCDEPLDVRQGLRAAEVRRGDVAEDDHVVDEQLLDGLGEFAERDLELLVGRLQGMFLGESLVGAREEAVDEDLGVPDQRVLQVPVLPSGRVVHVEHADLVVHDLDPLGDVIVRGGALAFARRRAGDHQVFAGRDGLPQELVPVPLASLPHLVPVVPFHLGRGVREDPLQLLRIERRPVLRIVLGLQRVDVEADVDILAVEALAAHGPLELVAVVGAHHLLGLGIGEGDVLHPLGDAGGHGEDRHPLLPEILRHGDGIDAEIVPPVRNDDDPGDVEAFVHRPRLLDRFADRRLGADDIFVPVVREELLAVLHAPHALGEGQVGDVELLLQLREDPEPRVLQRLPHEIGAAQLHQLGPDRVGKRFVLVPEIGHLGERQLVLEPGRRVAASHREGVVNEDEEEGPLEFHDFEREHRPHEHGEDKEEDRAAEAGEDPPGRGGHVGPLAAVDEPDEPDDRGDDDEDDDPERELMPPGKGDGSRVGIDAVDPQEPRK